MLLEPVNANESMLQMQTDTYIMSTTKKRKTNYSDDDDDFEPTPYTPADRDDQQVKRRKSVTAVKHSAEKKGGENPGLVKLKEKLFRKGLEEIAVPLQEQCLSSASPGALAGGEDPVFCRNTIVQYSLKFQDLKRMYRRPTGDVIVFGQDEFSQLGLIELARKAAKSETGGGINGTKPTLLPELTYIKGNDRIIQVAAGALHSLAVTNSGMVKSFGVDDEGQLGRIVNKESDDKESNDDYAMAVVTPTQVTGFFPSQRALSNHRVGLRNEDTNVMMVDAGISHTIALTFSGNVYVFGG